MESDGPARNTPSNETRAITGRNFLRTVVLTFIAIAALFSFDTFLSNITAAEGRTEAKHLFDKGQSLMRQGSYRSAIEALKDAVALERNNADFRISLAEAFLDAGDLEEARESL